MMKSNKIILGLAIITCGLLLALWFALGFNEIDNPLDLTLAVVWLALVVTVVQFVRSAESRRREALRTCYVGDGIVFNQESGVLALQRDMAVADAIEGVVSHLDYGFDKVSLPESMKAGIMHIVHTTAYNEAEDIWEGEVAFAGHPEIAPVHFDSKVMLAWALLGQNIPQEVLEPETEVAHDAAWRTM